MNNKIIVVKNSNDTCDIIVPADDLFNPNSRTRIAMRNAGIDFSDVDGNDAESEILNYIIQKDVPQNYEFYVTTRDKIPNDRFFRQAWKYDATLNKVNVDLSSAKEIKKEQIRQEREKFFKQTDIDILRAIEDLVPSLNSLNIDTTKIEEIIDKKQKLRDATKNIPNNLDQLKVFNPPI